MLSFRRKLQPHERRRSERHLARGPGQLLFGTGSLPRDCWISDISDLGVRLHAEVAVPDEFILLLTERTLRRECRVAWRLGHEIGAEFIDAAKHGFARRVAGGMR